MSTALTILKKLESISIPNAAAKSIEGTEPKYKELLQDQLLHGKGSDAQDLRPGYLEDPYFKSRESAMRYLKWKENISPKVGRNPNAPNLYITGFYHGKIDIKAAYSGVLSTAHVGFANNIELKYDGKANILGGEWRIEYLFKTVRPKLIAEVKSKLR